MEFAVAGMLIFLGILNLTGVLRWLTQKLETVRPPVTIAERKDSLPKFPRAGASWLIDRRLIVASVITISFGRSASG